MLLKVVSVAILLTVLSQIRGFDKILGPADVDVKRAESCPDAHLFPSTASFKRTKISRTEEQFDLNFTLDRELGPNAGIRIELAQFGDGGWKEKVFVSHEDNMCEYCMKYSEGNFKKALECVGAPQQCPVAKGRYEIVGQQVDMSDLPEVLTYGEFRIDVFATDTTTEDKLPFMCMRIYADVIPKRESVVPFV